MLAPARHTIQQRKIDVTTLEHGIRTIRRCNCTLDWDIAFLLYADTSSVELRGRPDRFLPAILHSLRSSFRYVRRATETGT